MEKCVHGRAWVTTLCRVPVPRPCLTQCALLISKYEQDYMHDNLLHFTFRSFSRHFSSTFMWRLGEWTKLEGKTSVSSVCPPRTLTWFQSSICVCDETDPRVLAGVSGYSAESIHARRRRMKMNFETEQLQSRVCRPPCIPTHCACEPIRAQLPGQTKRAAAWFMAWSEHL